MKNKLMITISTAAAAILALMIFASFRADAQDGSVEVPKSDEQNQTETIEQERGGNLRALEGSWSIQVTRRDCQTGAVLANFPTMTTFARGGTMQEYGVSFGASGRAPGHGVWSYEGGRNFSNAFQFFLFGADGQSTGRNVVRRQIQLSRFGSGYTSTNVIQTFNPGGTVIGTVCATEIGTRFE